MVTDTDGVAGESDCFVVWHREAELVRNTLSNRLPTIAVECVWKIQKLPTAQWAETGIEVVEAVVDEFDRNDFSMEPLAEDRVHADIRSLSVSAEPHVGKS